MLESSPKLTLRSPRPSLKSSSSMNEDEKRVREEECSDPDPDADMMSDSSSDCARSPLKTPLL